MEKEYYLIRCKAYKDLYIHEYTNEGCILTYMKMENVTLQLKNEAEKTLSKLDNPNDFELYPINDYIANRKTPIQK